MDDARAERRRNRVAVALLVLAGAAFWSFYVVTNFSGLTINDGYAYAACARNVLEGEGLLWESRTVQEFAALPEGDPLPRAAFNRVAYREALYPLALAAGFAIGGANELTIVAVNGLFFLATIGLVFLLTRRLFGYRAAVLAGLLTVMNAKLLFYSASGDPLTLYAFLLVAAALGLLTGTSWRGCLAGGIAAGLIWWTKGVGGVIAATLVGVAIVLRRRDPKGRGAVAAVLGVVAVVLSVRAAQPLLNPPPPAMPIAAVSPVLSTQPSPLPPASALDRVRERLDVWAARVLIFSEVQPGHTVERSLRQGDRRDLWRYRRELAAKTARNAAEVLRIAFLWMANPPTVWLFWIGGLLFLRDPVRRRVFLLVIALLAVQGAVCCVLFVMHRYFHAFIPLAIVVAAGGLARIGEGLGARFPALGPRRKAAAAVVAVAALSLPWCVTAGLFEKPVARGVPLCDVQCWYGGKAQGARLAKIGGFVRENTGQGDVVVSDAPWVSWWHGDRASIWLPLDMDALNGLGRRVQVDWLLITFQYWRGLDFWKDWLKRNAAAGGRLDGYAFRAAYVDGDYAAYLFRAPRPEAAPVPTGLNAAPRSP
jgi:hypothetical protein